MADGAVGSMDKDLTKALAGIPALTRFQLRPPSVLLPMLPPTTGPPVTKTNEPAKIVDGFWGLIARDSTLSPKATLPPALMAVQFSPASVLLKMPPLTPTL